MQLYTLYTYSKLREPEEHDEFRIFLWTELPSTYFGHVPSSTRFCHDVGTVPLKEFPIRLMSLRLVQFSRVGSVPLYPFSRPTSTSSFSNDDNDSGSVPEKVLYPMPSARSDFRSPIQSCGKDPVKKLFEISKASSSTRV